MRLAKALKLHLHSLHRALLAREPAPKRESVSAPLNRPLSRKQEVTSGLAATLSSRLSRLLDRIPIEVTVNSALTPEGETVGPFLNIAFTKGTEPSATDLLRRRMNALHSLLKQTPGEAWAKDRLLSVANSRKKQDMGGEMKSSDFDLAMAALIRELQAEQVELGYQYYDQAAKIEAATASLEQRLKGEEDLHFVLQAIAQEMMGLFRNISLYLYDDVSADYVLVLTVGNGEYNIPGHSEWKNVSSNATFNDLLKRKLSRHFFEDVSSLGSETDPISAEWRTDISAGFNSPRELRVAPVGFKIGKEDAQVMGFLCTHQWRQPGDQESNSPHYSRNNTRKNVDAKLRRLEILVAGAIDKFLEGRSIRELWHGEAGTIRRLEQARTSQAD